MNEDRPVEKVLKECMFDAEVLHCLQPLPASQNSGGAVLNRDTSSVRSQPYKTGKGRGKSMPADKGKGKGKVMPQEMVALGCRATTNAGQPICGELRGETR